jgi:hypothetical protein
MGNGPELCWEASGGITPLNLISMTAEEKEVRHPPSDETRLCRTD